MAQVYKLTDADSCTRGGSTVLQWGEDVTHDCDLPGEPPKLCSGSVVHAYESPLVAALMDPIHGSYGTSARLWEATGDIIVREGPLKCGTRSLTTLREIPLSILTTKQRAEIAIRCALTICREPTWVAWAEKWLNDIDRSGEAARAVARSAARTGAWAAEAAWTARTAAWAAEAAARTAAWAAEAAWTARTAARTAARAAEAAWTAAEAAEMETVTETVTRIADLDLHGIIAAVIGKQK